MVDQCDSQSELGAIAFQRWTHQEFYRIRCVVSEDYPLDIVFGLADYLPIFDVKGISIDIHRLSDSYYPSDAWLEVHEVVEVFQLRCLILDKRVEISHHFNVERIYIIVVLLLYFLICVDVKSQKYLEGFSPQIFIATIKK